MRSIWQSLVFATAGLVVVPVAALADDVQDQLQQMQQRMNQLEDRLQATTDQLQETEKKAEEQQALIERSGIATGSGGASGLSAFIDSINVGGHVSTSYNYNFNDPNGAALQGANGLRAFDQDSNSFALDQIRFMIERPVNTENRAGFMADIYYGKTARILNSFNDPSQALNSGDDNEIHVSQAMVMYQEPFGDVQIKMGKFVTLLGAEVVDALGNFNVSRGLLFTNAIPAEHLGVLAGRKYENGVEWALGVVNGWDNANGVDFNESKSVTGRLAYSQEMWGVMLNGIYGNEQQRDRIGSDPTLNTFIGNFPLSTVNGITPVLAGALPAGLVAGAAGIAQGAGLIGLGTTRIGDERDERGVLDVIFNFNPTENLKTYVNFDFGWEEYSGDSFALAFNPNTNQFVVTPVQEDDDFYWGVSAAGRYAITDRLGLALRGEYLKSSESGFCTGNGVFGLNTRGVCSVRAGDASSVWGITTTLDYALTEHLIVRTEFRYDRAMATQVNLPATRSPEFAPFAGSIHDTRETRHTNQQTVAAELIYKF